MSPPDRWLDSSDPSLAETRALLRAGLDVDPPPGAEDKLWAALSLQLSPQPDGPDAQPDVPSPDAGSLTQAATAAAGAGAKATVIAKGTAATLALKIGSVIAVVGGLAGAGSLAHHEQQPRPPSHEATLAPTETASPARASIAKAEAMPEQPAPIATEPPPSPKPIAAPQPARLHTAIDTPSSLVPQPEPPGAAKPEREPSVVERQPEPPGPTTATERASRLREESALVGRANAALRSGNAAEALSLLGEAQTRFGGGVLGQERAILTIEALAASGQRAAASSRAQSFAAAHPTSPYLTRLKPYLPLPPFGHVSRDRPSPFSMYRAAPGGPEHVRRMLRHRRLPAHSQHEALGGPFDEFISAHRCRIPRHRRHTRQRSYPRLEVPSGNGHGARDPRDALGAWLQRHGSRTSMVAATCSHGLRGP